MIQVTKSAVIHTKIYLEFYLNNNVLPTANVIFERNLTNKAKIYTLGYVSTDISRNLCIGERIMHLLALNA